VIGGLLFATVPRYFCAKCITIIHGRRQARLLAEAIVEKSKIEKLLETAIMQFNRRP